MNRDGNGFSDGAMEDVAYLSRSESRAQILDALATGSYTSGELTEATGISRTTVSRTINEFEERGWAERRNDGSYSATPVGEQIIDEFGPFVRSVAAIRTLGDLVAWLPTDQVPIGLHNFQNATILRPKETDPTSTLRSYNERIREASEFRCIVGIAPPLAFERAMRDGTVERDLETEHVITVEELNYLLEHPERLSRWREYLTAGANVYCYDGRVPCNIFVFDDTVVITNGQSDVGEHLAGIECENEEVLRWARDMITEYRKDAKRLDSTAFRPTSANE